MGCKHSTPTPTEADFLVEHEPPPSFLCKALEPKSQALDFRIAKNSWDTETLVDLLNGLKLVPDESPTKATRCALLHQDTPLAVLQVKDPVKLKAQICSFTQNKANEKSCDEYQGRPLFQCAMVAKEGHGKNQYIMRTLADDANYKTDFFGPIKGPTKLVVKRNGVVCATFEQEKHDWKCRVGPGIDPAMMVCFIACHDKLCQTQDKNVESGSYPASYNYRDVL